MNSIKIVWFAFLASLLIDSIIADCCKKDVRYQFLQHVTYEHCEGKDSGNYTLIVQYTRDSTCSRESTELSQTDLLLSCSSNSKQTNVNVLKVLASSLNPNGALLNAEVLYLVIRGPLEGKYMYEHEVLQEPQYLKICSSILGYSYISSKSNTLLISDKLDMDILISPIGAFELFKKGCTTICQGNAIGVGPTAIIKK